MSPRSGRLKLSERRSDFFSRPFHGLFSFWTIDPTTEVLGYFQASAARTRSSSTFFLKTNSPAATHRPARPIRPDADNSRPTSLDPARALLPVAPGFQTHSPNPARARGYW